MSNLSIFPDGDGPEWRRRVALAVNTLLNGNKRATAPESPAEGDSYYDTALHKQRTFDGSLWRDHW